ATPWPRPSRRPAASAPARSWPSASPAAATRTPTRSPASAASRSDAGGRKGVRTRFLPRNRVLTPFLPLPLCVPRSRRTTPLRNAAMNRIDTLFARLRSEKRRALMPFVTAGDPDLPTTAMLINELVARGSHLVEVGIPYSDPIADGPVIAASYHRALQRGVKVSHIFQTLRTLRAEGSGRVSETPMVSMV